MSVQDTITLLNRAVADELSAIHQYMYFHFHLDDQGFRPLAALFKKTAIREMGHLEQLAERVLFLGGDVQMSASEPVKAIVEPVEILATAAKMEQQSAAFYNNAAAQCGANADAASKQLFEGLVLDEESHFDEFQRQMDHIKRFGPAYLALQSFGAADVAGAIGGETASH
jgi:bacterioferritin